MPEMLSLLPLALTPCTLALFIKLTVFLLRRVRLRWAHAFIYGVLATCVGVVGGVLLKLLGPVLPLPVGVLAGASTQLLVGGWYVGRRGRSTEGIPIRFKGGILVVLINYLLVGAVAFLVAILVSLLSTKPPH